MTNPIRWFLSKWLLWVFEADRVPEKAKRRAA